MPATRLKLLIVDLENEQSMTLVEMMLKALAVGIWQPSRRPLPIRSLQDTGHADIHAAGRKHLHGSLERF
jgi:hypothetical protein